MSHIRQAQKPSKQEPEAQEKEAPDGDLADVIDLSGLDNTMAHAAPCCSPIPGDEIMGFVTRGRGLTIHRTDCTNVKALMREPDRIVAVTWGVEEGEAKNRPFTAMVVLLTTDNLGQLAKITSAIASRDVNIRQAEAQTESEGGRITLLLDVEGRRHLDEVIRTLREGTRGDEGGSAGRTQRARRGCCQRRDEGVLMDFGELDGVTGWRSSLLDAVPAVRHVFTSRLGGASTGPFASMNLSVTVGDDEAHVRANRAAVARAIGISEPLVRLQTQVHGAHVHVLGCPPPDEPVKADAFVTAEPWLPVIIGVADCAPVLVASTDGHVVAAIHAGWRGAVGGVVPNTVERICAEFGVVATDLVAAVGPCIGPESFQVGPEVAEQFERHRVAERPDGLYADLPGTVLDELQGCGIPKDSIDVANVCTMSRQDVCFSHRGSGGLTGRMIGLIVRAG